MNEFIHKDFLVFDIRSGGSTHDRLCEIAVVLVRGGEIYDKGFWEVKPQVNPIYERDFRQNSDHDPLPVVWRQVSGYFEQVEFCTAYNLSVHKSNLEKSLAHYGIGLPKKKYFCTYAWSVDTKPDDSKEDDSLADALKPFVINYQYAGSHLNRAIATAELVLAIQQLTGRSVEDRCSALAATKLKGAKQFFQKGEADVSGLEWSPIPAHMDTYWNGRIVVVTGEFDTYPDRKELTSLIEAKGGKIGSGITSKTNTVLIGSGAGPSKVEKIQALIQAGKQIDLFNEDHLGEII